MALGADQPKRLARTAAEIHRWSGFRTELFPPTLASSDGKDAGATLVLAALEQLAGTTVVVTCSAWPTLILR